MRRTLAVGLAVIAPLAPAFFSFLIGLVAKQGLPEGANPWSALMRPIVEMWSFLMLPMLVALQAALMAQIESANAQWKHLYALPLSRTRLYLVKAAMLAGLILLSTLLLVCWSLLAGLALGIARPPTRLLEVAPDWAAILRGCFTPFAAALLLIAIHQWVGMRWPTVVVGLGVGIVGLTGCVAVIGSAQWGRLYPWALPFRSIRPEADDVGFILAYSLGAAAVTLALGAWRSSRRDMV